MTALAHALTSKRFILWIILALSPALSAAASYPDLAAVTAPNPVPALPSHFDAFTPPVGGALPTGSPVFAEWVRRADPGDTLLATGSGLGSFLAYGQTSAGDGVLSQPLTVFQDADKSQLSLKTELPANSMILLWSANASGHGRPVALNRTEAWWLQDTAIPGETAAVFGRNFFYGKVTPAVYVQQGSAGSYAQLLSWNPYRIEYVVPAGLTMGQPTQVWVHNGHGAAHGWSGPLALNLRLTPNNAAFWSGATFNVKDYGAKGDGASDDGAAIRSALNAAAQSANTAPATVFLPAGTYMTTLGFNNLRRVRWMGAGKTATTIKLAAGFSDQALFYESTGSLGHADEVEIRDMTLDINNNLRNNNAYINGYKLILQTSVNYFKLSNLRIYSGMYVGGSQAGHGETLIFKGVPPGHHAWMENCDVYGGQCGFQAQTQVFIKNCNFYGQYDAGSFASTNTGIGFSMTGCTARDFNPSGDKNAEPNPHFADGRLFVAGGSQGSRHVYIGGNTTYDFAPRTAASHSNNAGEQILWESGSPGFNGRPTSSGPSSISINKSGTDYGPDSAGRRDYYAVVLSGKGLGQHRNIIADNGSGTFTVSPPWNVVPDASSVIQIQCLNEYAAVYDNSLQGKADYATAFSASSGVQPYGNSFQFEIDSNVISRMRHGLFAWSLQDNNLSLSPSFFLMFKDNSIADSATGARALHDNFATAVLPGTALLGVSFRRNLLNNSGPGMMANGFMTSVIDSGNQPDRLSSTLIEHNRGGYITGTSGLPSGGSGSLTQTFLSDNVFSTGPMPTLVPTTAVSPIPFMTLTFTPAATRTPTPTPSRTPSPAPSLTRSPTPVPVTPGTYVRGGVSYRVAPGTILYATLDGGLKDLSGNGHDLVQNGGPAYVATGPLGTGSALGGFSTADYVSANPGLNQALRALSSFSLEFYARGLGAARCSTLLYFGSASSDHWRVDPCIPNYSNFFFTTVFGGGGSQVNARLAANYQPERWYFMSFSYDAAGGQLKGYADGVFLGSSGPGAFLPLPEASQFLLGKGGPGSSAAASNIHIGELRILDYAKADGARTLDIALATATPSVTESFTATRTGTRTSTRTATASSTATSTRTVTATATPSASGTATPSATGTRTATPSATPSATGTATPSASGTATPSATGTRTATPSATPSATGTATPSATGTVTDTVSPTLTWTFTDTATLSASPSATPSLVPTSSPMANPGRPRYVLGGLTYEVAEGTVFYSTLDGNALDLSGHANHLLPSGSPSWAASAPAGFSSSAGGFSGTSYFAAPADLIQRLKSLGSFSLEFHVQGLGTARCSTLLYFGGGAGQQWYVNPCIPDYTNFFFTRDLGSYRQANARLAANYLAGKWYQMVLSYDAAAQQLRAYADGQLLATAGGTAAGTWASSPQFWVGKGISGAAASNLNLSQLRILDYAKSEGSQTRDIPVSGGTAPTAASRGVVKETPRPSALFAGKALLAYPNPARGSARVALKLESAGRARLVLADLSGATVQVLDLGSREAGESFAELDLRSFSSGLYFLRLESDEGFGYRGRAAFKLAIMK